MDWAVHWVLGLGWDAGFCWAHPVPESMLRAAQSQPNPVPKCCDRGEFICVYLVDWLIAIPSERAYWRHPWTHA